MSFEQQLISWRRELHQNPELSLQEVATTARIRDWLQSGGLTLLPYNLKTGLVAEVGSGDKVIALRADIDALPIEEATGLPYRSQNQGVMHACGHDIHTSVMLGAALLLKEREAELPGRVRILFQPAEENFGGAKTLIRAGRWRRCRRSSACTMSPACRWANLPPAAARSTPTSTASSSK